LEDIPTIVLGSHLDAKVKEARAAQEALAYLKATKS